MKSLFRRQPGSSRRHSRKRLRSSQALAPLPAAPVDNTFGTPGLRFVRVALVGATTGVAWVLVSSVALKPSSISRSSTKDAVVLPAVEESSPVAETIQVESLQPFQLAANANDFPSASGNSIRINGQTVPGVWQQRNGRLGLASAAISSVIGAELLSTTDPAQQPIRWFPATQDEVNYLPAWWDSNNRYVDVTDFASRAGWSVRPAGATLQLGLPAAQVSGIRQGK